MVITLAALNAETPTLESVEAEPVLIRLQCAAFTTVDGMQRCDGHQASRAEVIELQQAFSRFSLFARTAEHLRQLGASVTQPR